MRNASVLCLVLLGSVAVMADSRVSSDSYAGPVSPWPREIPARVDVEAGDELFVMTLGQVRTPLANAKYDPRRDTLTREDGEKVERYYADVLETRFFEPLDKRIFPVPPSGWCSWYYYYQEVTPEEVLHNARWIAENLKDYGARYVQLDDGWQGTGHGLGDNRDWTTIDERFRDLGMAGLAKGIRDLGLEAGLWLAPHGQSNREVVEAHPGAFLLNSDGASASETWEGMFLVDPTTAAGQDHLRVMFEQLRKAGYTYFKIDGQPIVVDEYTNKAEFFGDPSAREADAEGDARKRAELLYRDTLNTIRQTIGKDSFLLGCWGIPLAGVGIMNGSRTAGDVIQGWEGFLVANDAVQRWNFLHNIAWYADPDVCMVRPPLREGTARAWATIQGLTGQALLTSDRLPDLPVSRVELLKRIYPATDIRPLDLFRTENVRRPIWPLKIRHRLQTEREYDVVGVFNYAEDAPRTFDLTWERLGLDPAAKYHVYDFWNGVYLGAWEAGVFIEVPPHDVRVITLVPATERPTLVSTNRHITQGWVELRGYSEYGSKERPEIRGRSRVIAGDPYRLTFGLPRDGKTYRIEDVRVDGGSASQRKLTFENHQGYATVTIDSEVTHELAWRVRFEPSKSDYHYPVATPGAPVVTGRGLVDADVRWGWGYFPSAGFDVLLDGELLAVAFTPHVRLRDLRPEQEYTIGIRGRWYDGSMSEGVGETMFTPTPPAELWLSELEPRTAAQDWGSLGRDVSCDGNPLRVAGAAFERGLGTHAASRISYRLYGVYDRFEARVGHDDEANPPQVIEAKFEVWGDGKLLWSSDVVRSGESAKPVNVAIPGVETLELRVNPTEAGIDYAHTDWLEARVIKDEQTE